VPSVQVNGLDISYQRAGAGPPLVLAHGAGDDSRIWQPQLDALADQFTVLAWDEPGAGRSSDLPAGFGLKDYAACLAGFLDALDLGPVHLAGLSWGGVVALQTYADFPRVVGTLVLADTYAGWKGSLPENEIRARIAGVRQMLAGPTKHDAATLPGLFVGEPPAEFAPLLAELAAAVRRDSLAVQLAAISEADLSALLPQVSVPTLLLWGKDDVRSPVSVAYQFKRAIADATLVLLPDCGHLSNLQQPHRFNEAVREHCLAHPLRGSGPPRQPGMERPSSG
jgi:pimeloyl-ACP methyl ester carboxylesterase